MLICTGCGGTVPRTITVTPEFVTATLPSTPKPQVAQPPTQTASATSAVTESNISLVEATTTTQLNVRTGPSSASESLGMIGPFVKVQVIGRDESGSWYQIFFAGSATGKGWVRAEYAQVNATAEIQLVEVVSGSGSAVSGLVIQKINVRSGPDTKYESLGILNSNDVVFITGKDTGGTWLQVEFVGAPGGKGWVTAEFLQVGNLESVPLIGVAVDETAMPANVTSTSNAIAMQDGDSMQAPLAAAIFSPSGSHALQVLGDVSAPNGDTEDWIQFTTTGEMVAIKAACLGNTLRVELWKDEKPVNDFFLSCGDRTFVTVASYSKYFLRLLESNTNGYGYTNYILSLESVR